jgi:3-oxoacyl-[acyl-carrier protein] reductase
MAVIDRRECEVERLSGRVTVVTGAGSGLGRAIAIRCADEGASVVVNDIDSRHAEETAALCREHGPELAVHLAHVADVSDSRAVDEMIAAVQVRFGRIDVLVTNAGIGSDYSDRTRTDGIAGQSLGGITDESWRRMLAVHLDGTFFCTRAVVPLMTEANGGSIVCIGSIAGLAGIGSPHYAAAKGGILGLVRSLARDLGPAGIRINAVCPGIIDAGITTRSPRDAVLAVTPSIPLRRLGEAEEIAAAVVYLASDESSYTTGQWLSPNGGLVIS